MMRSDPRWSEPTDGASASGRPSSHAGGAGHSAERISSAIIVMTVLLCFGWDAPAIVTGSIDLKGLGNAATGDRLRQVAFLLLFAIAVAVRLLVYGRRFLDALPAIFIPILTWCWLSPFWAIYPAVALRRIGLTTILIVIIVFAVGNLSYRRIIESLLVSFWLILVADWIAIALFAHAIHGAAEIDKGIVGTWRGIHNNKNEAGAFCALATILFLHEAIRLRSFITGGVSVVLSVIFLYQTHSKTSLALASVALVVGASSYLGYRNPRLMHVGLLLFSAVVVPACIVFSEDLSNEFSALMADPASLTGRVQIWAVLVQYSQEHPLLGSGFGSFWGVGGGSLARAYSSGWITEMYTAHNGYLDLLVQTGIVGLTLAVVFLVLHPTMVLFSKRLHADVSRSMLCAILVFGWLRDMLESSLLDRANATWAIMVVMYCVLYRCSGPGAAPERPVQSATSPSGAIRLDGVI